MRWRRTDPVQTVDAIILISPDAASRLSAALRGKSALFHSLDVEQGSGWAAIFAGPPDSSEGGGGEAVLPHIEGGMALYAVAPGWWLPVGLIFDLPDHAAASLRHALCERYGFKPPAIVVPCFEAGAEESRHADLYLVRYAAPFHRRAPSVPAAAWT